MRNLFQTGLITLCLFLNACDKNQGNATSFTESMITSQARAVENLEENTNIALSQAKSWLEDPVREQFRPIQGFAEQVDAAITELQSTTSEIQLLLEKSGNQSAELQAAYLRLRTQLEEEEQELKDDYELFLYQHQQAFSYTDEELAIKIQNFNSQVILLDEAWSSLRLEWSTDQFKMMLAKTNLDLATLKNWIINDLSSIFGGRAF